MQSKIKGRNGIHKLTAQQAKQLFNAQVRQAFKISGPEFIRMVESGQVKALNQSEVMRLSMMIPLGR